MKVNNQVIQKVFERRCLLGRVVYLVTGGAVVNRLLHFASDTDENSREQARKIEMKCFSAGSTILTGLAALFFRLYEEGRDELEKIKEVQRNRTELNELHSERVDKDTEIIHSLNDNLREVRGELSASRTELQEARRELETASTSGMLVETVDGARVSDMRELNRRRDVMEALCLGETVNEGPFRRSNKRF